ncbi:MAG: GNAT family N-acetyltransferase [bacterium]
MIHISHNQLVKLKDRFLPERPGPLVEMHIINTGHGECFVDRWPDAGTILTHASDTFSLVGDADTLEPKDLKDKIRGLVTAPESYRSLLTKTFPDLKIWNRIIFELAAPTTKYVSSHKNVRRLTAIDAEALANLSAEISWISNTWGGPRGLVNSGFAWGAYVGQRLVSVACTFYVGENYEDIGVVTESAYRRKGLSIACAGSLCKDIFKRGRKPSWTTSPDNPASMRVAEKLGFCVARQDVLYVVGMPIPG